jgi:hypothetical protein
MGVPHTVSGITAYLSSGSPEWSGRVTGAADGPRPAAARRLADVKDNRDATVHGGRTAGQRPGAARDEQGEVTA